MSRLKLRITEQSVEDVRRLILIARRVTIHIWETFDSMAYSWVKLRDGWELDSSLSSIVEAADLHCPNKLSKVEIWRGTVRTCSITSIRFRSPFYNYFFKVKNKARSIII